MERRIVCFAVPSFELALARRTHPELRGRPVAVAARCSSDALLRDVSAEAAAEGLSVGMPIHHARRLCRTVHIWETDAQLIHSGQTVLETLVAPRAPLWESTQPGMWMLDLTGTRRLFGAACDVAAAIQRDARTIHGLEGLAGVGGNKLVAQTAAALIEPSQLYDVKDGAERLFMSPLPITLLPGLQRPCMRTVRRRLEELNLTTMGDVADTPLDALEAGLGPSAGEVYRWAQGIDHVPVLSAPLRETLEETLLLDPALIDDAVLLGRLLDMLQRLCRTLRAQRRTCRAVRVLLRYRDRLVVEKTIRFEQPTCWEFQVEPHVRTLFQRAFRRRIRLALMGLALEGLAPSAEQGSLFDLRPAEDIRRDETRRRLASALDHIQRRFGDRTIRYGRPH